jgi:hypothetical protein
VTVGGVCELARMPVSTTAMKLVGRQTPSEHVLLSCSSCLLSQPVSCAQDLYIDNNRHNNIDLNENVVFLPQLDQKVGKVKKVERLFQSH